MKGKRNDPQSSPWNKPWNDLNWELPSLAVVVCAEDGDGCVLWTVGAHLTFELEEIGCANNLSDLGLDDAPIGISVWEGKYAWEAEMCKCLEDVNTSPSGKFRNPTTEEWTAIQEGRCPWDARKWE